MIFFSPQTLRHFTFTTRKENLICLGNVHFGKIIVSREGQKLTNVILCFSPICYRHGSLALVVEFCTTDILCRKLNEQQPDFCWSLTLSGFERMECCWSIFRDFTRKEATQIHIFGSTTFDNYLSRIKLTNLKINTTTLF